MNSWSWLAIPIYSIGFFIGAIVGTIMDTTNNNIIRIICIICAIGGIYVSVVYMDKLINKELKNKTNNAIQYKMIEREIQNG